MSKAGSANRYTFLLSTQISWRDRCGGWKNVASVPMSPAIRRRSERIGRSPKALILGDPCIRFGFGGKARGDLWQSAGPDHLHGEAVIVSLDHAVIRCGHGCPSQVNAHVRSAVMSEGGSCNTRSNLRPRFDCGRVRRQRRISKKRSIDCKDNGRPRLSLPEPQQGRDPTAHCYSRSSARKSAETLSRQRP